MEPGNDTRHRLTGNILMRPDYPDIHLSAVKMLGSVLSGGERYFETASNAPLRSAARTSDHFFSISSNSASSTFSDAVRY